MASLLARYRSNFMREHLENYWLLYAIFGGGILLNILRTVFNWW